MKVWLIGLGLALLCIFQAVADDPETHNHKKALETWYVLGKATNCTLHKDDTKITMITLSKTDGGVKVVCSIPTPNGCQKTETVFTTGKDGKFGQTSEFGKKTLDVLETDLGSYGIITMSEVQGDISCKNVTLLGKRTKVAPEINQKFINRAKEVGLSEEQVMLMSKEVACMESD